MEPRSCVMRCLLSASPWWSNYHFNDNVVFAVGRPAATSLHVTLFGLVPSHPPISNTQSSFNTCMTSVMCRINGHHFIIFLVLSPHCNFTAVDFCLFILQLYGRPLHCGLKCKVWVIALFGCTVRLCQVTIQVACSCDGNVQTKYFFVTFYLILPVCCVKE